MNLKLGLATNPVKEKKAIPVKSAKKIDQEKREKKERDGEDTMLQKWFANRRKEMKGFCQCGCTRKSSKHDDLHYRSSCAHIFPKSKFPSIALHKLNFVERNFWDGCHSDFDNKSMDLWVNMEDWDDIKEKFHHLAPLLTDEERATKFYKQFEKLVYSN